MNWIEIVIQVLRFLIALLGSLSGVLAIAQGVLPSSLALPTTSWFWIFAGAVLVFGVLLWLFERWRQGREGSDDAILEDVLDFVEDILESLKAEAGRLLSEIPQATVEEAARQVYRQFIAGTPLGAVVAEEVFVSFVVERWRRLAGIESAVHVAITAN